jgi:hypothetical protein
MASFTSLGFGADCHHRNFHLRRIGLNILQERKNHTVGHIWGHFEAFGQHLFLAVVAGGMDCDPAYRRVN